MGNRMHGIRACNLHCDKILTHRVTKLGIWLILAFWMIGQPFDLGDGVKKFGWMVIHLGYKIELMQRKPKR